MFLAVIMIFISVPIMAIADETALFDTYPSEYTYPMEAFDINAFESYDSEEPFIEIIFEHSESEMFPFFFEILEYSDGVVTLSAATNVTGINVDDITITLSDESHPNFGETINILGEVFDIDVETSYSLFVANIEDDMSITYHGDFMATFSTFNGQTFLSVRVSNMMRIENDVFVEALNLEGIEPLNSAFFVRFNGNGHTSGTAPASITRMAGSIITLPQPGTLRRSGHIFIGWNTLASGTGVRHAAGGNFQFPNRDTELFAHWVQELRVTSPGTENEEVPFQNLILRWTAVANGTSYTRSLRNLNTNNLLFTNVTTPATSYTVLQSSLVRGHRYRVAISASFAGNTWWAERHFSVAPINVTSVSISPTSATMNVNDTRSFSATVNPSNATNVGVTWSSNNTSVATVNAAGTVTARAAGTATITVSSNSNSNIRASANVTVQAAPTLTVSPTTWSHTAPGSSQNFTITTNQSSWSVGSLPNWLSHTRSGNTLTLSSTENPGAQSRSATVTVSAGGLSRQISVSQSARLTTNAPAQRSVSGTPTATSLSVNSTTAPNGWTTQYRIRTAPSGTWGGWQNSSTFTGLNAGTNYHVQARFTANNTNTHAHSNESQASANIQTARHTTNAPAQRTVSGTPTATSLAVNSTTAPNGWTTQYRIRTAPSGTWGSWQNSNTFTGLLAGTDYQVQARFTANNTNTHVHSNESTVSSNIRTAVAFVAVTGINNVPTTSTAGSFITLSGTVAPTNATNQTITWSVQNAGTTGATITNVNRLNTPSAGTVTVRATIINGAGPTSNFTRDFNVTVGSPQMVNITFDAGNSLLRNRNGQWVSSMTIQAPVGSLIGDLLPELHSGNSDPLGWSRDRQVIPGDIVESFGHGLSEELMFGDEDSFAEAYTEGIEPFNWLVNPGEAITGPGTFHAHVRLVRLVFSSNAPNASYHSISMSRPARSTIGTFLPPAPRREGYSFVGWSTTPSHITGEGFNAGSAVPEQNTTFFALWEPLPDPTAGITVTVYSPAGLPLQGALVQFVECISNGRGERSYGYITDANGRAFFPNAPSGDYGINVTHRDFISTHDSTSRRINRSGANQIQTESFTMTRRASDFRRMDWGPVLEDMRTPTNPRYRITSVYGYRSWANRSLRFHSGIDINEPVDNRGEGRILLSPFNGRVVQESFDASRGNFIVLEYEDDISGTFFYVRYLHMQRRSHLNGGNTVNTGMPVGFLGNTGDSGAAHLHLDVHHGASANTHDSNSIDPRAFFPENFATPFNGITMR